MIRRSPDEIRARAEDLVEGLDAEVVRGESVIGGGATPEQRLPTWVIALSGNAIAWERKLRAHSPPIVARIEDDRLILDLRTVFPSEEPELRHALSV
jgi:L-seryl-tRNA(Ser) seleniumtransferase